MTSSNVTSFLIWTWWLLISFISVWFFFPSCSSNLPVFLSTVSILLINFLWLFIILISIAVMLSVTLSSDSLSSLKCFLWSVLALCLVSLGVSNNLWRCWRIKLFYVQKCRTEINQFKVFDDLEKLWKMK